MPKDNSIKSVLIIGSGPIVIGQACEFDYAGSQSARSIREEGIEVILINSNPATIMTDPSMADHVYLLPLTTKSIIQILKEHPQIDSVLPTMGGQTALNLCLEADEKGIWKDFKCSFCSGRNLYFISSWKRNSARVWFSASYSTVIYFRWNWSCNSL